MSILSDLFLLIGMCLIVYGLFLICSPIGFIAAGVASIAIGYMIDISHNKGGSQ